jgi:predicted AlkP superfamily phosphohydrolase/phosphomutase
VRYEALGTVSEYYLRYTQPRSAGNVPEDWRRHFAQVIDRQYAFVDNELGAALDAMRPGDVVMVVSGFGIEPINPLKRLLGRLLGDPDFTGTHERAPEGFLLAYGADIAPGRRQRGSIVDVAPTLLYFLGLPIARDMDGYARTDIFTKSFTSERPVAFIPSYQ